MITLRSGMNAIRAPMRCRNRASSITSGSVAAPRTTVRPRASEPASSAVSVAPTLG